MTPAHRGRPTLRDVAERAGVSTTTASFVLSGRRDMRISAATEERVVQAARTLDYRRRLLPRHSLPPSAPAIGLISDVVATEPFAGEMLRGCIAAATAAGHVVLMADSEGVPDIETSAVEALRARGVERFLHASLATIVRTAPAALRHQRVVLLNNTDPSLRAPAVIPDDKLAGTTAATALLDAGHTSGIWLVGTISPHGVAGRRRLSGIRAALRAGGQELAGRIRCDWWPESARLAVAQSLAAAGRSDRPTALIALNDRIAMGAYQALGAAGLRVPEDVSVVSFDNSDLARWLDPGLSSLELPYFAMGRRAVELLLADDPAAKVHKLPMPLRPRDSVRGPRSGRPARDGGGPQAVPATDAS